MKKLQTNLVKSSSIVKKYIYNNNINYSIGSLNISNKKGSKLKEKNNLFFFI